MPPPSNNKDTDKGGFIPSLSQGASIGVVIAGVVVLACLCSTVKSQCSSGSDTTSFDKRDQKGNYSQAQSPGSAEMYNYSQPAKASSDGYDNAGPEFTV